ERGLNAGGVGDVALESDAADVLGDALRALQVDVEHGDFGAQAREFACGGFAEAGAAAGDECGLSLNLHVCLLWVYRVDAGSRVPGAVPACSAATRSARCLSTARWLIEP